MNIQKLANKFRNSKWAIKLLGPIWLPIKYRKHKKDYKNNATEMLLKAKECLDNAGLFFWLDFGTLLGAYREKDFIKHDMDVDIAMFAKDAEAAKNAMLKGGFKLYRTFEIPDDPTGVEQTYIYKGVYLDIYFYIEEGDFIYCNSFYWLEEDDYMFGGAVESAVKKVISPNAGFETMMFKGEKFNVPKNLVNHLTVNYGSDFMTPNKKFNSFKQCRNTTYYSKLEKVGIYTKYD